ncbi:MAG: hypothetical protein OJF52_003501 [Nitrospira sp.]|nr:MAG: hypothetical protein OJF52_003501 [Nitrospira sp.]
MTDFLFENIWMLSHRDRRGRLISFHPRKNLIVGLNHTGKSSLIKTLFLTLGARPKGHLREWDQNTVSLVEFTVGQKRFRALHHRGFRALFDHEFRLINATAEHLEWSESFARATGFNLVVTDKNLNTVIADPRCFFTPFYIDQDGSWQSGWDTFPGMQQYSKPFGPILEYFAGIKPAAYYEVKAMRDKENKQLDESRKEQRFLEKAKERFGKTLPLSGPKVDPENFDAEIEQLNSEVSQLNKRQEELRDTGVRQKELQDSLRLQIDLAQNALHTYEDDTAFLRREPHETLVCPTCGAEHEEQFLEILTYAENARVLHDLSSRLQDDLTKVSAQYQKTQTELLQLESSYRRISNILDTRRGTLVFRQVVDSMGAERAFRAFFDEGTALSNDINARLGRIEELEGSLKSFSDRRRSKAILSTFRGAYAAALVKLNSPPVDSSRVKLTSRPSISGSGGPRSVLAYYGALWQTCYQGDDSFGVPLVIDSPNQQGQDIVNMPKVLAYLTSDLPSRAQVIVGSETDTELIFDMKLVLSEPYKLLQETEFSATQLLLDPLIERMYEAVQTPISESETPTN